MDIIETEYDVASQLLKTRMRLKKLSQLSYELKAVENAFPVDYYLEENAEGMLKLYALIENKILELSEEIKNNI